MSWRVHVRDNVVASVLMPDGQCRQLNKCRPMCLLPLPEAQYLAFRLKQTGAMQQSLWVSALCKDTLLQRHGRAKAVCGRKECECKHPRRACMRQITLRTTT